MPACIKDSSYRKARSRLTDGLKMWDAGRFSWLNNSRECRLLSQCFVTRASRWKGRTGLSHKPIKSVACLSDSMLHKAPAERGVGFASSTPSTRSRQWLISKAATFTGYFPVPTASPLFPSEGNMGVVGEVGLGVAGARHRQLNPQSSWKWFSLGSWAVWVIGEKIKSGGKKAHILWHLPDGNNKFTRWWWQLLKLNLKQSSLTNSPKT